MSVNHESAFSGHLGAKKTEVRILPNFFWPGLRQDVIRFCRSCDVCQRTVKRGTVRKVPLGSMPLIDTPFKRVAVDIVRPIAPPSEAGHWYILTLVDYTTRYPEAVSLKKITTEAVAEALLDIYSRVGIPEEVLTDLLKKGKAKHIQWSEAQERAYSLLKKYLLQEPVLKLPDLSKPFVLQTDASGVGVAAVLLQENDRKLDPVGYASKKLNLTEARYPIIEKECLAVVWGIERFKLYLAGRRFTLQTDHKPLKYLKEASHQNDQVFRWAVAVQEYSFRVEDIPGKENIGADFLSRTGDSC